MRSPLGPTVLLAVSNLIGCGDNTDVSRPINPSTVAYRDCLEDVESTIPGRVQNLGNADIRFCFQQGDCIANLPSSEINEGTELCRGRAAQFLLDSDDLDTIMPRRPFTPDNYPYLTPDELRVAEQKTARPPGRGDPS